MSVKAFSLLNTTFVVRGDMLLQRLIDRQFHRLCLNFNLSHAAYRNLVDSCSRLFLHLDVEQFLLKYT
jgi:hypothetical protein